MFFNCNGKWFSQESGCINPRNADFSARPGLIETMLFENGAIRFWKRHYARLIQSAVKLNIPHRNLAASFLEEMASVLIQKNEMRGNCVIRLQVFPPESVESAAGFLMECFQPAFLSDAEAGKRAIGIAQNVLKRQDRFSGLKTSSRLPFQVARRQAEAAGWYDALLLNQYGRVAESTISNVFWVAKGHIFTPPLHEGCIAGVLRQQLLNSKLSFSVTEKPLSLEELKKAEEVFLTNAIRGIQPVHCFEDREYATICTLQLRQSFRAGAL